MKLALPISATCTCLTYSFDLGFRDGLQLVRDNGRQYPVLQGARWGTQGLLLHLHGRSIPPGVAFRLPVEYLQSLCGMIQQQYNEPRQRRISITSDAQPNSRITAEQLDVQLTG